MSVEARCEQRLIQLATALVEQLGDEFGDTSTSVRRSGPADDPVLVVQLAIPDGAGVIRTGFVTHIWYGEDHDGVLDDPTNVSEEDADRFVERWFRMLFRERAQAAFTTLHEMAREPAVFNSSGPDDIVGLEYGGPGGGGGPVVTVLPR